MATLDDGTSVEPPFKHSKLALRLQRQRYLIVGVTFCLGVIVGRFLLCVGGIPAANSLRGGRRLSKLPASYNKFAQIGRNKEGLA